MCWRLRLHPLKLWFYALLMQENNLTVSLAELTSPDAKTRKKAGEILMHGFTTHGLIYVQTPFDTNALIGLYQEFYRFTQEPLEVKERYNKPDLWYQRGWTPPNTEHSVLADGQPDYKECWFAAPEEADPLVKKQFKELYADNIFPNGYSEFERDYLRLGRMLTDIGMHLLKGCALAMDLPEHALSRLATGGPHVFRLLKYLALNPEDIGKDILWGEEHTDFNLLTLLPGGHFFNSKHEPCAAPDDGSGLFLRTVPDAAHPEGAMVRGTPPKGCIVAQVGQQMEILTGGLCHATPHVITAPRTPGFSRLSAAHFIHMHSTQTLFPLPPFQSDRNISRYAPPVLAGTYSIKTLMDIGLAPPSSLSLLGYRHYDRLERFRGAQNKQENPRGSTT